MFKFKDILAIILGAGIFFHLGSIFGHSFHFYEGREQQGLPWSPYYLLKVPVSIMNLPSQYPSFHSGLEAAG